MITHERMRWLDALRGAAVLAIIPLNARWLLHPSDAYHDPSLHGPPDALAWLWWAVPELLLDHSTLFALAAVFGVSLAAARAADSDPGWTRRHRARLLLLGMLGFVHGALVWPGDILYPYAVTALLLTGAVREARPDSDALAWVALTAAAIPPALGLASLHVVLGGYAAAGLDPRETYALATPEYRTWESSLYAASFTASLEVKWAQWSSQITTTFGSSTLWHAAAGMLAGVWWHRRGRRLRIHPNTPQGLVTAGLALTGTALALATRSGYDPVTLTTTNWMTYAGGALLSAAAVLGFTRANARRWETPIGEWLQSCGRASLSIYLLSSLLLAAVAQGWGLGLHGKLDPHQTAAATLVVMTIAACFGLTRRGQDDPAPSVEQVWRLGTRLLAGRQAGPERSPSPPSRADRQRGGRSDRRNAPEP